MNYDLLTRLYLRQYALVTRSFPKLTSTAAYHFSTLAISGFLSLAVLSILAIVFLLGSLIIGKPLAPWNEPDWALLAISIAVVFVPGLLVDRKMKAVRPDRQVIAFFSSPDQRKRWWLTVLTILPLTAIVAACFSFIRAWQQLDVAK